MFKELAPYLRQRAVLLTVTHIDEREIRVNIVPQKLKEGENTALTTPLTVTGSAEDLDRDLPSAIVGFVATHLELKNTLDRAKAEMDAAGKAAQAEARSKAKTSGKKEPLKLETTAATVPAKPAQPAREEPAKPAGLFDTPAAATPADPCTADEEDEILAEVEDQSDEGEPLDDAA
jgi:PRTRC genetic system protein E